MLGETPPFETFRRNLILDVLTAMGVGLGLGLVGGLLPGVARRAGADPFILASLSAAPFLASMGAVLSGRMGPGTPRRVAAIKIAGLLGLVLTPFVPVAGLILVVLLFWMGVALSAPNQHRIWGVIYPPRLTGRLVGVVRTAQAAAAALSAIVGGVIADRLGGPPVIAAAGVLSALFCLAYAGIRAPSVDWSGVAFSTRDSVAGIVRHPVLRPLLLAQGLYGTGAIAATPLLPLVQVDRLGLSLAEIGSLGIASAAMTTLSAVAWGALSDRWGGGRVMQIGALLGSMVPLGYFAANDLWVLWLASIASGLAGGAIEMGLSTVLAQNVPTSERPAKMAGWSAIMGTRGLVAPFVSASLVQSGVADVNLTLLVCTVLCFTGNLVYLVQGRRPPRRLMARAT